MPMHKIAKKVEPVNPVKSRLITFPLEILRSSGLIVLLGSSFLITSFSKPTDRVANGHVAFNQPTLPPLLKLTKFCNYIPYQL